MKVKILGGGLAGCEAAWQLLRAGLEVELYDMKGERFSPAHHDLNLAELVCSNSLRSDDPATAPGQLKWEMRQLDSLLLSVADSCRVAAGSALAVDRERFAATVTARLLAEPGFQLKRQTVRSLAELGEGYRILAPGPLADEALLEDLQKHFGDSLFFYDAAAPIVMAESLRPDAYFMASRYQDGPGDYWNCPLNQEAYSCFYQALLTAERAPVHGFEEKYLFSACQPIESIALQGEDAMRFGPLKPVGLIDPRSGKEPYACVQLRAENEQKNLLNLVGFQTRLRFPEQKRVFGLIPALAEAEFVRYGVMHRNSFICSPRLLDDYYRLKTDPSCYIVGQFCGVEGYLESAASGLLAARHLCATLENQGASLHLPAYFCQKTMIGALAAHVSHSSSHNFQPMKANFGLMQEAGREELRALRARYGIHERGRRAKRLLLAARAQSHFAAVRGEN